MNRRGMTLPRKALIFISVILGCTGKEQIEFPQAVIIVGEVILIRNGKVTQLKQNQYLRQGDTVRINENAKVKFELPDGAWWYLNRNSELAINESVPLSGVAKRLSVSLLSGQFHIVKRNETPEDYLVSSYPWNIRVTAADISISTAKNLAECNIILLSGFATFTPKNGVETVIPACNRLYMGENGLAALDPLRFEDVASVKGWVGSTVVEEALKVSGCTVSRQTTTNEPPRWIRLPRETAVLKESFIDTVEAEDPEMGEITYALFNAPADMTLDKHSGVLKYRPDTPGEYKFGIIASDVNAVSCTTEVSLSVSAGLSLRLMAPRTVMPGRAVSIAVSPQGRYIKRPLFRFDLNGDGRIDFPSNGRFGIASSVKKHVYTEEGVFTIKAEALLDDGQIVSVRRSITVNAPPIAILKALPENVKVGDVVELDVSASTDSRNGNTPLKVRYDVDGDGKWDLPEDNRFLHTTRATYAWEKVGSYKIIAEVVDKDGASDTASVTVNVRGELSGGTIECGDTVNAGDSIKLKCIPPASDFAAREFAWSFDGDTVYEKKGEQAVVYACFRNEGKVEIKCRMSDEKGNRVVVVKKITVKNEASIVEAGGPYRGGVNKPLELVGAGKDRDNRIIRYYWDIDGDGKVDWSSKDSTGAFFTYRKSGRFSAMFCIETDDGRKTCDSATVEVVNRPPRASAGEDIVSRKGRTLRLNGTAVDEDGTIALFAWDFDGDGNIDWKSEHSGIVEREFSVYTNAVFRAYDSDGDSASDTVRIVICPDDMRTVEEEKFCIDAYEFPNRQNEKPLTDVSYEEAQELCTKTGKHLCTAAEWEKACRDVNKNHKFPYGVDYDASRCNTLENPRVGNGIAPSGYFIDCKSSTGVYDMSGNVAEWVESGKAGPYACGGSWQNGGDGSGCGSKIRLQEGRKYFYVGFRCCK